mmetsp:Transcript_4126/g.13557  ORF Transcript_4126/g.13557 Transcript_4126/m.13557 type:complete len:406 (+) Transcript_4126:59-1276(+)
MSMRAQVRAAAQLLGVAPGASAREVKAAFRRKALAARAHPDLVSSQKATAAKEEFIRLRAAASLLLDPPPPPERESEGPQESWGPFRRGRRRGPFPDDYDFGGAVARPTAGAELAEALRRVAEGPELLVDAVDKFPACLEMEERNGGCEGPLLRLTHGPRLVGEVSVAGDDRLELTLFGGAVEATATRKRSPSFWETTITRGDARLLLASPASPGLSFCGFGSVSEHTLFDEATSEGTHRYLEYKSPGVHVGVWRRVVPTLFRSGLLFDPSPVVATVTKAWFPHKRFWPTFFQHLRPETHASDGTASAFYLERKTSASASFGPPPDEEEKKGEEDKPPDDLRRFFFGPRKPGSVPPPDFYWRGAPPPRAPPWLALDPVCCVFAAAFHTFDNEKKRGKDTARSRRR